MSDRAAQRSDEGARPGRSGGRSDGEHLSPKTAAEQDHPEEERPPTPLEEAGERKGDEEGDSGTARRGP